VEGFKGDDLRLLTLKKGWVWQEWTFPDFVKNIITITPVIPTAKVRGNCYTTVSKELQ
jgi:hypothetical protein